MPSRARAAWSLLLFSLPGGARASVLLFEAASEGDVAKLQMLLEKDKYDVNWRGEYGMSPVHVATLNNHAECVRLLIRAGAKVNQFDNDGWTPLMAAAAFAEHKMVKMLLDAGANPTRRAQTGHHKGMNAKDLVKDVLEQKGSMATKCIELLEEGVKTWWAKKEAKERRREGRAAGADADAEGLGDAVADDSADTKSEL